MQKVEGWVFTYNSHIKKWMAVKREHYNLLFNDVNNDLVLKSGNIATLCELIIKTNGDINKLKQLVK